MISKVNLKVISKVILKVIWNTNSKSQCCLWGKITIVNTLSFLKKIDIYFEFYVLVAGTHQA